AVVLDQRSAVRQLVLEPLPDRRVHLGLARVQGRRAAHARLGNVGGILLRDTVLLAQLADLLLRRMARQRCGCFWLAAHRCTVRAWPLRRVSWPLSSSAE